jgi:hypothetical protein
MATLYTLLIGFLGGVLGAVITDFVRAPFRQFFTLRTEIRHEMLRLANVSAPDPRWSAPTYSEDTLEKLLRPSREAQATLRSLGTRMIAFAETEWIAANSVQYLGYDPLSTGHGLIGLSNSIQEYGAERAAHRTSVNKALRFRD